MVASTNLFLDWHWDQLLDRIRDLFVNRVRYRFFNWNHDLMVNRYCYRLGDRDPNRVWLRHRHYYRMSDFYLEVIGYAYDPISL